MFQTPEQVAGKLLRVIERKSPEYKQDRSLDACLVDCFLTRFVPWRLKVTMNRRLFRLSSGPKVAGASA